MLDYKPNMVLSNEEFDVIGSRPIRPDGIDKVTGRARYGADTNLPGLLYGKILRSPHAHAVIKSIDTSAAEAQKGVYAVVTSADWPETSTKLSDLAEGAIQNLANNKSNAVPIAPGKAVVFNSWQPFNVGDGRLIVGLSKSGAFYMSGHVVRKD